MRICLSDKSASIYFWHITESLNELFSFLPFQDSFIQKSINAGYCEKRKKERIAAHILLHNAARISDEICHSKTGRPFLKNTDKNISISHTNNYVALAVSDFPIGIDIEVWGERAYRLRPKFLAPEEIQSLPQNTPEEAVLLWSAKEAVFKRFDIPHTTVGDIRIHFHENGLIGHFHHTNIQTKIEYVTLPSFVLTYTTD